MKSYKLFYAYYPFDVENLHPESETVEAESLTEAINKLKKKLKGEAEVFEAPARKRYNEPK